MQEQDDSGLLREYVERNSEEAFAALVSRHINKVYSAALRHTGDPGQAEEITQAVFLILARKARQLSPRVILSGWLYQTARLTAKTFIRSNLRRLQREHEAYMQTIGDDNESGTWRQIAPLLDAAMAGLNEVDRYAVVLRFFDGKSMREVGDVLGANEQTARKRVNRALEKLRVFFKKRGIVVGAAAIGATLAANSVQAAPAGLAGAVMAAGTAKGATSSVSALALAKATTAAMKTKTILTLLLVSGLLVTGGYLITRHPRKPANPPLTIIGVGLYLGRNQQTHKFEVRRVFPNSPAAQAGVVPGLVVNKIDGVTAETKSIKELSALLAGKPGTTVKVEVIEPDGTTRELDLARQQFVNKSAEQ
jgi:RNA polymerase sigma factor (sigma-70 family)